MSGERGLPVSRERLGRARASVSSDARARSRSQARDSRSQWPEDLGAGDRAGEILDDW